MPRLFISAVPVARVAKQDVLHHLRKRRLTDLNQMMHMISHQHIGIKPVAKSLLTLFKKTQIALTILIVFEDRLTLIAPRHDVIEPPGEMYPRLPGHN